MKTVPAGKWACLAVDAEPGAFSVFGLGFVSRLATNPTTPIGARALRLVTS